MRIETYEDGKLIGTEELPDPPPEPLSEHGALVTLLAVQGVITADDGAKLLRVDKTVLEAEALAWEAAKAIDVEPVAPVKR